MIYEATEKTSSGPPIRVLRFKRPVNLLKSLLIPLRVPLSFSGLTRKLYGLLWPDECGLRPPNQGPIPLAVSR